MDIIPHVLECKLLEQQQAITFKGGVNIDATC